MNQLLKLAVYFRKDVCFRESIKTPSGKIVGFCSIWQVDTGTDVPRFITMYPR